MSKKGKIAIVVILIILVIICIFTFSGNGQDIDENVENNIVEQENIIQENIVEENEVKLENIIEEDSENETVENMIVNTEVPSTSYQSKDVYESNPDIGTTDKKQEAINLVKIAWGEDNSVTFSCDSITSEGEYIIAVTSIETATVRNYFRVNLENQTVSVEY